MATITLPSTTSLVDFLKGQGKDSSFSARSKLYKESGLGDRLGEFAGSASQNSNLLKYLQTKTKDEATAPASATPATDTMSVAGMSAVPQPNPITQTPVPRQTTIPQNQTTLPADTRSPVVTPESRGFGTPGGVNLFPESSGVAATTPATSVLQRAGMPGYTAPGPATPVPRSTPVPRQTEVPKQSLLTDTPPVNTAQQTLQTAQGGQKTQQPQVEQQIQQSQNVDTSTKETTGGISASTLYPDIFTNSTAGESDLVNKWLNSAEGQSFINKQNIKNLTEEAKAAATKQELERKYASEKETLEQSLAEKGLAFSGIRGTKVKALADSLAASTLNVDRELASKLLDADASLRDAIIKGVADLAKEAKDKRKEAIDQLNAIGYAVIGDKLVPTLSAKSAERADAAAQRAEKQLSISERRLQLAEEAATRASTGNKVTYSEAVNRGLPLSVVGQSEEEIAQSFYSSTPPQWFKEKVDNEKKSSTLPGTLDSLWNEYRTQIVTPQVKAKTPTATVIGQVRALKDKKAPQADVDAFIRYSGYEPSDAAFK